MIIGIVTAMANAMRIHIVTAIAIGIESTIIIGTPNSIRANTAMSFTHVILIYIGTVIVATEIIIDTA